MSSKRAKTEVIVSKIEWATWQHLVKPDFFWVTKELYDIEYSIGHKNFDCLQAMRRFEYPWVYIELTPLLSNQVILDAGAGQSPMQLLLSKTLKVHSVDIGRDIVDWINSLAIPHDNITGHVMDITQMGLRSESFDRVICISVLEHLPKEKVEPTIAELLRVTKRGGKVILTMDIALDTEAEMNKGDFTQLARHLGADVPSLPSGLYIGSVVSPEHRHQLAVVGMVLERS